MKKERVAIESTQLRQAAGLVADAMLKAMPTPSSCEHAFSQEFLEKMDALLLHNNMHIKRKRIWKRIAAAIAAVLIGLASWLTVDAEAREQVFRWFAERFGSTVVYHFSGGTPGASSGVYAPEWVPEGFTETRRNCQRNHGYICFADESTGQEFVFSYDAVSESAYERLDDVVSDPEIVSVQGHRGEYYVAGGDSICARSTTQTAISARCCSTHPPESHR